MWIRQYQTVKIFFPIPIVQFGNSTDTRQLTTKTQVVLFLDDSRPLGYIGNFFNSRIRWDLMDPDFEKQYFKLLGAQVLGNVTRTKS